MAVLEKELKIRSKYKPSDDELEALKLVYDRYDDMKSSPDRTEAEKNWDKWEKQWESYRTERDTNAEDGWKSNHVVPLTTGIVESILAEIIVQTPRPLILPRGMEDAPKAKVMKFIFDYIWEVADGDVELFNVIKDSLIYGTGIAQEFYWKDRRLVRNLKIDKKDKETFKEVEADDYDDCYMEAVKLQDFYVDEKARGFSGPYAARDCIRRYIMNIEDFKVFFKGSIWNSLDNVKYVQSGGDTEYYEFFKPPEGINKEKEVEVLWYWAKKPKDWLIIVANDVVVRMGPNI